MSANAQDSIYVSMISDYLGIKITINYHDGVANIVKEQIKHDSTIGQRVYNLTDLEWENNKIFIPDSLNYWFIPFDDIQPFVLMPRTYLLSDCKELYVCRNSSCAWVPINGGCDACKCGDQTSNPCKAEIDVKQNFGNHPLRTGGGIILKASAIGLETIYKAKINAERYRKISLTKKNNIAFITLTEINPETSLGMCIINATNVPWKSDFVFQPPDFGRYWFIPFDGSDPFVMREPYCYSCTQGCACPDSNCEFRYWSLYTKVCSCVNASTTCCTTVRCPCGEGTNRVAGSGMIIEAEFVIIK